MNCNETFLNEVTHVELIPASACTIPVPPMANSVTELSGCTFGTAAMVIDINDNDNYAGTMDSAPTLKTTEKAQAAGFLRQHDLSVPVRGDFVKVRQAQLTIEGADFHVVLHTADGTRFLLYSLPNTARATVEEQFAQEQKQTVKVSMQSMSNMIRLT